jgi:dinuclear metal center YbgI/SA1388 family protein
MKIETLLSHLLKLYPQDHAENWDNVGLIFGDTTKDCTGIIVSINLNQEAIEEAKKQNANLIIVHHPPIFKPILKITKEQNPWIYEALTQSISVIALHTNYDLNAQRMYEEIAKKLDAKIISYLAKRGDSKEIPPSIQQGKFITFVPETHVNEVREAVCRAGAGVIGDYSYCSFTTDGEGSFKGNENTNPYLGQKNNLEFVKEKKLEVIFPWKKLEKIIEAAKSAHPYEEMAYDVVKLENPSKKIGYGFIANLNEEKSSKDLILKIKEIFNLENFITVFPHKFDKNKKIKKIAFSPGSGSSFIGSAIAEGVELYITGEVGFHEQLKARDFGVWLAILGHHLSEYYFVKTIKKEILEFLNAQKINLNVFEVYEKIHEIIS